MSTGDNKIDQYGWDQVKHRHSCLLLKGLAEIHWLPNSWKQNLLTVNWIVHTVTQYPAVKNCLDSYNHWIKGEKAASDDF